MPMGTTTQSTGSEGYSNSPLSQIAGLGSLVASLFPQNSIQTELAQAQIDKLRKGKSGGIMNKAKGGGVRLADGGMAPSGAEYHDGKGNFYDADGYLVG